MMDFAALVKKRMAEHDQVKTDELVENARERRAKTVREMNNRYLKKYRETHRAEINERARKWRASPEGKRKKDEYYQTHKEQSRRNVNNSRHRWMERDYEGYLKYQREHKKAEYERRRDEILARQREAYKKLTEEQREKIRVYQRKYREEHRAEINEKARLSRIKRNERKKQQATEAA